MQFKLKRGKDMIRLGNIKYASLITKPSQNRLGLLKEVIRILRVKINHNSNRSRNRDKLNLLEIKIFLCQIIIFLKIN